MITQKAQILHKKNNTLNLSSEENMTITQMM